MKGPIESVSIALIIGLYLAILMDRYEGTHSAHTIALLISLYMDIIVDQHKGPIVPLL
jgi:hypothetical protein